MLTCIYDMFLYISQPSMFNFRVRSPSTSFIIHLWIANIREIKITQAVPSWILPMIFKKNLQTFYQSWVKLWQSTLILRKLWYQNPYIIKNEAQIILLTCESLLRIHVQSSFHCITSTFHPLPRKERTKSVIDILCPI